MLVLDKFTLDSQEAELRILLTLPYFKLWFLIWKISVFFKVDEGGREDDGSDESDNVADDLLSNESVKDDFRFLSEDYISSPKEKQNVTENEEKDQYGRTGKEFGH